ncbi:HIT-like protein [Atractiella rhizophila]|nr:HIT-like protein [Atractiella rhizophila]
MAALLALENYAKSKDPPKELGKDLYLVHDEKTLTIYDCYPKAKYHFLIMPRLPSPFPDVPASSLSSLRSLLSSATVPRSKVVEVLEYLRDKAEDLKKIIEERMVKEEGFKWDIQVGFHASESMKHLHLHVISTDFQSDRLKHKKHWNSFHPELGFFLHLSDLLENLSYPEYTLKTKLTYEMKLMPCGGL